MSSFFQLMKAGYQDLVNAIIRPPRCAYTLQDLGPDAFDFRGLTILRSDFNLLNAFVFPAMERWCKGMGSISKPEI